MKFLGKERGGSAEPPPVQRIRSRRRPLRHLETLEGDRRKRWRHREFLVEGVRSIAQAEEPLTDFEFGTSTLLVLGNEASGLSAAYRERCDAVVSIPMLGKATSLNVTSAASILLYEIRRQRIIGD